MVDVQTAVINESTVKKDAQMHSVVSGLPTQVERDVNLHGNKAGGKSTPLS